MSRMPADLQEPGQPDTSHGGSQGRDHLQGVWKGAIQGGKPEETPRQGSWSRHATSTSVTCCNVR